MKRLLSIALLVTLLSGFGSNELFAQEFAANQAAEPHERAARIAKTVEGYLFTSLNGEKINQVISFERYADGTLGAQRAYSTGSLGGANRAAGGDAAGDFDSQGALQIIDDHVLVVNAGGIASGEGALRTCNFYAGGALQPGPDFALVEPM